jgi:glycosyltransferase involved in cell wall biosynthesis
MAKITFGMIVKNSMPWIKYSLNCVYEFAHEIIIVYDNRSIDETLEYIKTLTKTNNKIKIIRGEWNNKTDQCNEYAKVATGDWLWQLDCDEIYNQDQLKNAINFLDLSQNDVYDINILNFFRNINTIVIGDMWTTPPVRIFRFESGDLYASHRPPTLIKKNGKLIKSNKKIIPNLMIFHYSHLGVEQVKKKAEYYSLNMANHPIYSKYNEWFEKVYMNKNIIHNLHITGGGDCLPFKGKRPKIIQEAITNGELNEFI